MMVFEHIYFWNRYKCQSNNILLSIKIYSKRKQKMSQSLKNENLTIWELAKNFVYES